MRPATLEFNEERQVVRPRIGGSFKAPEGDAFFFFPLVLLNA